MTSRTFQCYQLIPSSLVEGYFELTDPDWSVHGLPYQYLSFKEILLSKLSDQLTPDSFYGRKVGCGLTAISSSLKLGFGP